MAGLRTTVLEDFPWAFWPLGVASPYSDATGHSHPLFAGSGTPTQVASIVTGDTDADAGALHSTGVEYLTLPFPTTPTSFTFELWVKTSGACTIWGSYPYCYAGIDGSGNMVFTTIGLGTYTATASLADGNLHHMVWTFNGATMLMYADGVPIGSPGIAPSTLSPGGSLFGYGSTPWLTGTLQDVASYDSVLDAAAVAAHYNAGTTSNVDLHLDATDSTTTIGDTPGRLAALLRSFGDTLASLASIASAGGPKRTAGDTIPSMSDTARTITVGAVEAQFHPEIVFKVFDLYTKEYFGMLPLDAVEFGCRYNTEAGTLQGTLSLKSPNEAAIRPEAIRLKRMIVVEINEWPLWVGLLDRLSWDSDTSVYQVRAKELWSFYDAWPLSSNLLYTGIEEVTIFADLIAWVTAQTGGNIGLTTSFRPSVGILRDLNVIGSSNALLGNMVRAHGISIFDGYQVRGPRVVYDDATQTPRLLMEAASPTLGNRYDASTPRFRYLPTGGEVVKVMFEDDAATGAGYATTVVGTSILSGNPTPAPLVAVAVNTTLIANGWPASLYVMPAVQDYKQATLQARVDSELARRASVYGAPSVVITLASLWQSKLLPGDDAVFVFQDGLRWPTKKVYVYRVTGIDVSCEAETATLTLDPSSVGELVDEVLTQMPGTTNQNPNNAPGPDPSSLYYPGDQGPGVNLPTNYFGVAGGQPPFTALIYRANQDGFEGATSSFQSAIGSPGGPFFAGSAPVGVAGLLGIAVVDPTWISTVWQGTITGAGIPVTFDLIWLTGGSTVLARTRMTVQAGVDPVPFSITLSLSIDDPTGVGSISPILYVTTAAGSWAISHLDAEFLAATLVVF